MESYLEKIKDLLESANEELGELDFQELLDYVILEVESYDPE